MRTETVQKYLARARPLLALSLVLNVAFGQAPSASAVNSAVVRGEIRASDQSPLQVASEILSFSGLAGGVVWLGDDEPVTAVIVPEGVNTGLALTNVLASQDKYVWRENDGVVNLLPRKGTPSLLLTKIPLFEWNSNELAGVVVGRLERLPEVVRGMSQLGYHEGLHHGGLSKPPRVGAPPATAETPQVFVRRNITLIELLNDIAKSYPKPAIWWYEEQRPAPGEAIAVVLIAN
jgi:hypothetical protein